MNEDYLIPKVKEFEQAMADRLAKLRHGVVQMPYLKCEHLVDLSRFATVDLVPLITDDLDTAVLIVNKMSDEKTDPIVRERSIELNTMTLHRTTADPIEVFAVDGVLHYFASRPAGPQI